MQNMTSAKLGHEWWQIDLGYYVFLLLEKSGLVWDLNRSVTSRSVRRTPRPYSNNPSLAPASVRLEDMSSKAA